MLGRVYALTALLGGFLLFQVQPILSKWILPWFGGGPAVWTACLLFFQSALFLGYVYAHASERWLPRSMQVAAHIVLILSAALFLPVGPAHPAGGGDPTWEILKLLTVTIGAPYVLLASTGPLVQAWAARAGEGGSPYRLYAFSNAGSLAGLLTYPFVVEPLMGLRAQSHLWTAAFVAFAVFVAIGAVSARRVTRREPDVAAEAPTHPIVWVLLPASACAMLLAATNQLCQDVAVIPFFWVLPLALYLVSFILAFGHPRWSQPTVIASWTALFAALEAVFYGMEGTLGIPLVLRAGVTLAVFFGCCMLCHGELSRWKPPSRHLTAYYLAISGGGALGGLSVSLIAPLLFSSFLEWKVGVAITYAAAWGHLAWTHRARLRAHRNAAACLLVAAVAGLALILAFFSSRQTQLATVRNFYGSVAVQQGEGARDLVNGRILHGRQRIDEPRTPTTYYGRESGVGGAMAAFESRDDLRVGVVGLGAGTMAAYGTRPSQTFRFYEINPAVERLAREYFTFLKDCPAKVVVVLGDARISLEREAPQEFHVLVLDAFSGDAIPTHLLTVEAMSAWRRHLAVDGVLAVHISNRHLDLGPVVRGVARRSGLKAEDVTVDRGESRSVSSSRWMVCTVGAPPDGEREVVWTDDRIDLLSVVKIR